MIYAFLDTQVFRRQNLIFNTEVFNRLVELVEEDRLTICLSDFVVGEVNSAIDELFDRAYQAFKVQETKELLLFVGFGEHPILKSGKGSAKRLESLSQARKTEFSHLLSSLRAEIIS